MVNYASLKSLAERLIEANGRDLTLVRRDQGNPADVAQPWRASTEAAEISFVVKGVFTEFEKEDFDGTLVRRGDKRVLISDQSVLDESSGVSNLDIEDYDHILDAGVRWKIINVENIQPGSTKIFYDLHVRQ
mgnify:CR=1 FL=1